jgi:hypothetical protein
MQVYPQPARPHLRSRTQSRRFNASLFERPHDNGRPRDLFSLLDCNQPYIEKRRKADLLHKRNFKYAFTNAVLSLLAIGASFLDNELRYYGETREIGSDALRFTVVALSLVQMLLTVQIARIRLDMLKLLGFKHISSTIHAASILEDRPRLLILLAELAHLCVVLPPGVQSSQISSNYRDLITFCTMFRLIHVGIFIYSQSPLFLPRAQFYT